MDQRTWLDGRVATLVLLAAVVASLAWLAATQPLSAQAEANKETFILCLNKSGTTYVRKERPSSCAQYGNSGAFAGGVNLVSLKWRNWGTSKATATGFERGFHLPYEHIPASVSVFDRERDCGHLVYTRLRATTHFGTSRPNAGACPGDTTR